MHRMSKILQKRQFTQTVHFVHIAYFKIALTCHQKCAKTVIKLALCRTSLDPWKSVS